MNLKKWWLILVAPLPFLAIYLHHWWVALSADQIATGFICYDMPYYLANGREIFEGGNGFAYPNPYAPGTEAIYFHWFIWLMGFGVKTLHLDPGQLFVAIEIFASFLFSFLTFSLLDLLLPEKKSLPLVFLLAMWGGGLFVLAKALNNLVWNLPLGQDLLAFDPSAGYWFFYWGRNLLYPTEAIYHSLFLIAWIGLLKKNWPVTLFAVALLAGTHPFSGIQLILIVMVYGAYLVFIRGEKIYPGVIAVFGMIVGLFAWYYAIYVNQFDFHRNLQEIWKLPWIMRLNTAFAAHLVVFTLVIFRFLKNRQLDRSDWLFLISGLVSLGLAKHDLLIEPHQPLHFTRGYTWFPFFILGTPILQRALNTLRARLPGTLAVLAITTIFFAASLDNVVFVLKTVLDPIHDLSIYLTPDEKSLMAWMDENEVSGMVLWPNLEKSYLLATYTDATPYFGHTFMTPDIEHRQDQIDDWVLRGQTGQWFDEIDYVIVDFGHREPAGISDWEILHVAGDLTLFARP